MKILTRLVLMIILLGVTAPMLFAAGEKEAETPTLSIICFAGYAEPDWVEPFEQENGCEVKVTYAGTIEEHFTKVKAAPDEYNIVSIDSGRVQMYYDAGLIQAIDTSKLKQAVLEHPLVYSHRRADGAAVQLPQWDLINPVLADLFGSQVVR